MEHKGIIAHLFRSEYRKIVAVLSKHFGFDNVESAEDIASEVFLLAAETWGMKGVPSNPTAWLYAVAKNKAIDFFKRQLIFESKIMPELNTNETMSEFDIDLTDQNIEDSQLQMMFAVCTPIISVDAQIGLSLKILCGFSIDEIANAFLSNRETITKRPNRAKDKLKSAKIEIEFPDTNNIQKRVDNVLSTLYLLFNEGYYSLSKQTTIRKDLCEEAMRLTLMLYKNTTTKNEKVSALLSLMCFHASRLDARTDERGELVLYKDQNSDLWDKSLIAQGTVYLQEAISSPQLSKYHLEAAIAYWHTFKEDFLGKWENILGLYNHLLQISYSPIAALNRTYAVSKVYGKDKALNEAKKINLANNQFYHLLLGYLYTDIDNNKALESYEKAYSLAKTDNDQSSIRKKIEELNLD